MVKTAADRGRRAAASSPTRTSRSSRTSGKNCNVTNDDFIRTTSERHKRGVQKIVEQLSPTATSTSAATRAGTTRARRNSSPRPRPRPTNTSPRSAAGRSCATQEPTYFFRLQQVRPARARAHREQPRLHPARCAPQRGASASCKQGVEDLSISRATLKWGIPHAQRPDHVLYVWIDALSNYITALGYGAATTTRSSRSSGPPTST